VGRPAVRPFLRAALVANTEVVMANLALEMLTLFAGVFSVVVGVFLMAATIGILVIPYILMMEEAKISDRLAHPEMDPNYL